MDKKNGHPLSEGAFIRRVTAVSVLLALLLLGILGAAWKHQDSIYALVSSRQAGKKQGSGGYAAALKTVDKITDETIRQEARYAVAQQMYRDGAFAEAEAQFSALGTFCDSQENRLLCAYALADQHYQAGNYETALTGFASLGGYSDAQERQQQTLYAMAEKALAEEDLSTAIRLWISIDDYADSRDRALDTAFAITADREVAETMVASGGQTQEALEKILAVAQRRSMFPETRVEAGAYHTVLLHDDGTVSAAGDNRYGQCDVDAWTNIVQISTGAYHTVGLRSDGTVVAAGCNDQGQCDVEGLTGIVQIAAGDSDTYALTKEGQVLIQGFHSYEALTRAANVSAIYAGSYGAAAVTHTGTLIPSHKSLSQTPQGDILSLGIHTGLLLTHYLDGTLSSTFDIGGSWENIVHFDVGPTAILAADLEGKVRAHFFREADALDFSSLEDVVQCAAGTSHFVFLTAEGELIALGDNTYGQCNVDSLPS